MKKCPYCHEIFNTQEGLQAHKAFCFHKENPLPEQKTEEKKELIPEEKKPAKRKAK